MICHVEGCASPATTAVRRDRIVEVCDRCAEELCSIFGYHRQLRAYCPACGDETETIFVRVGDDLLCRRHA